jgi:hypothetical protein
MESFDAEEDSLAIPIGFALGSLGFVLTPFRLSAGRCQGAGPPQVKPIGARVHDWVFNKRGHYSGQSDSSHPEQQWTAGQSGPGSGKRGSIRRPSGV